MSDDSQQRGTSDGSEVAQKDARQGNEAGGKTEEKAVAGHDQGTDHAAPAAEVSASHEASLEEHNSVVSAASTAASKPESAGSSPATVAKSEAPKPVDPAPVSAPSQPAGVSTPLIVGLVIVLVGIAYAVAKNQGWLQ